MPENIIWQGQEYFARYNPARDSYEVGQNGAVSGDAYGWSNAEACVITAQRLDKLARTDKECHHKLSAWQVAGDFVVANALKFFAIITRIFG